MGKIVVSENITLDGVVQDPAGAEGFGRGGWVGRVGERGHEEAAKVLLDEALGAEGQLFGRRTYEFLAARWPSRSGGQVERNAQVRRVLDSEGSRMEQLDGACGRRHPGGLQAEAGVRRGDRRRRQHPARPHADGPRPGRRAAADDLPGRARGRRAPLRRDQRPKAGTPRRDPDRRRPHLPHQRGRARGRMNYYDTLIEVADDCPATEGQIPQERGGKKTKAVVEYELLVKHPYTYTEEDIAFEVYAVLHEIPKASWPKERERFLSKGHSHLRVSALAKRYGWGIHNNAEGKIALIAVDSPEYKRLMKDPRTTKIKAFRSKRA